MYEDDTQENSYSHSPTPSQSSGVWKARFITNLLIISFSFVGLILSTVWQKGAWDYWRITITVFTLLSIWLCWYTRKHSHGHSLIKVWQEILLWIPLYCAGGIFSVFVEKGVFNNLQSGFALLIALGMTLFIGGIFIEGSFVFSGLCILAFSAGTAYLHSYLYTILLPLALFAVIAVFLFSYLRRRPPA